MNMGIEPFLVGELGQLDLRAAVGATHLHGSVRKLSPLPPQALEEVGFAADVAKTRDAAERQPAAIGATTLATRDGWACTKSWK